MSEERTTYFSRKMALMMLLGFSSGLPLPLIGGTLQAWMTDVGTDIKTVGLFTLVGLPYAYKLLWAPFMDTLRPPMIGTALGLRRAWMVFTQASLVLLLTAMALINPSHDLELLALLAVGVAFAGASQDIVVDAYRTDVLSESERGPGAAIFILGYRLALLCGGLSILLADYLPWQQVYLIAAITQALGIGATLLCAEVPHLEGGWTEVKQAAFSALREIFGRPGALEFLALVLIYKLPDVLAAALTTRFMMDLGFTKTAIGSVAKSFGLIATIGGALIGGTLMVRLGTVRALFIFGILQAVSVLAFAGLAQIGNNLACMAAAVAFENVCNGMATAAFTAFLMGLCNRNYTATQYALLTSLMAITRYGAGSATGFLVSSIGWSNFFVICALSGIPGLLLLSRAGKWGQPAAK
ncbi:MAG: MFS transporter [Oligoflexia bacterium]|nr:MFS transporter [Oligoflexia bacterium]